jgi:hypothetical protein
VIRKLDRWNDFRKCRLQLRETKSLLAGVILPSESSLALRSQIRTLSQLQELESCEKASLESIHLANKNFVASEKNRNHVRKLARIPQF